MGSCSFLHFHRLDKLPDCLGIVGNLVDNEFVSEMVADIDGILADIGSCIYQGKRIGVVSCKTGHTKNSL